MMSSPDEALVSPAAAQTQPTSQLQLLLFCIAGSLVILVQKSYMTAREAALRQALRRRPRPPGGAAAARIATWLGTPGAAARLQASAGAIVLLSQVLAMLFKSGLPQLQHWRDVADGVSVLVTVALPLVALPAAAPLFFERHRPLVVGATRAAIFSLPIVRNTRGMQHVFQSQPSPSGGAAGFFKDLWQLILGSRCLAMFGTPIACPLPVLPHLALAAFAFQRCRTAEYVCSAACPLLRHPIWQRRIHWLHEAVHKLPLLVPQPPLSTCTAAVMPAEEIQCRVFLTFFQMLLGVVAPTIVVANLYAPIHAAEAQEAARLEHHRRRHHQQRAAWAVQAQGAVGSAAEWPAAAPARWPCGKWKVPSLEACRSRLATFTCTVHAAAGHLCIMLTGGAGGVLALASWWLLVSLLWVLALLLEYPAVVVA